MDGRIIVLTGREVVLRPVPCMSDVVGFGYARLIVVRIFADRVPGVFIVDGMVLFTPLRDHTGRFVVVVMRNDGQCQ